jgi:phosphoenolpyruvate carboxykinase (ATP)
MSLKTELKGIGITARKAHHNLSVEELYRRAVADGEARLNRDGILTLYTGKYTGRSPNDRFIVDTPGVHEKIAWGAVNAPIGQDKFDLLYRDITAYLSSRPEVYVFDGTACADPRYARNVRVVNEHATPNLFIRHLLRRLPGDYKGRFRPDYLVLHAPGCQADPKVHGTRSEAFILLNLEKRVLLIGGTQYCGEIKKSVFSLLNGLLPQEGVLSMHCGANVDRKGDATLFFGLSGTGKTTLSMDLERKLIGDDEHGWSPNGIFNIEGGAYAKCISLRQDKEPLIYAAIRPGAVVENVVIRPDGTYDFNDGSITENTRAGFPLEFIPNIEPTGMAGHPRNVVFLTYDAFGVLPPIAKLTPLQAIYHFISGYTSKVAGTERGIKEPQATFSFAFGAPFMPLKAGYYTGLLQKRIADHKPRLFLLNTGLIGGPYGVGKRIDITDTRRILDAALTGKLDKVPSYTDPNFGLEVPLECPGTDARIFRPRDLWTDKAAYDAKAKELAQRFREHFKAHAADVPPDVKDWCEANGVLC